MGPSGITAVVVASLLFLAGLMEVVGHGPGHFGGGLAHLPLLGLFMGPAVAVLASALAVRAATQRSLRRLLTEARSLDEGKPLRRTWSPMLSPAAAELSTAMRLSALRLQQQVARERTFSSDAAHQLRGPLAALRLRLEEVVTRPDVPRDIRVEIQAAVNETDRLAGIASDLLVLARTGTLADTGHETDLARTAVFARLRWAPLARAAGRELRLAAPMVPAYSSAAYAPVGQILDVLIDNAIKHGSGDIEIGLTRDGDNARLSVSDEGTTPGGGRSRAGRPVSRSEVSAGIGLPLARRLADAMGGRIVDRRQPTTTYELVIPAHGRAPVPRPPRPLRKSATSFAARESADQSALHV